MHNLKYRKRPGIKLDYLMIYIFSHFAIYLLTLAHWRAPSLSLLTPMAFNTGLTHFGSEAYNCHRFFGSIVIAMKKVVHF